MNTLPHLPLVPCNSFFPYLFGSFHFTACSHDVQELQRISKRAEQWRGPKGERRKVQCVLIVLSHCQRSQIAVYDYIWEEEGGTKEVTTHVSIHTIHLDGMTIVALFATVADPSGSRELFRQFLRLPDGAIVEVLTDPVSFPLTVQVFGSVNADRLDGRVKRSGIFSFGTNTMLTFAFLVAQVSPVRVWICTS